jgi:hypothetical protein
VPRGVHSAAGAACSPPPSPAPAALRPDSASTPEQVTTDRETQAVRGKVSALGSRVLTTTGFDAGTVVDVEFDTGSGELTAVRTDTDTFSRDRLRSLGSYALVVEA